MRRLPFPPETKFVCYLRDSGGIDQELSTDQQLAEINALCHEQGFILTRVFEDKARSGRRVTGRDGFFEMVHYLTKDGGSGETGVLIWSFARFARNFKQFSLYCSEIELKGYKLISLIDDVPDTPEGELMRTIMAWSYERQVAVQAWEIRRGLFSRARAGGFPAGYPAYGLKAEGVKIGTKRDGTPRMLRRLIHDPARVELVRRAWQMRAEGRTIHEIHDALRLYRSHTGYRKMFRNPIYIGLLSYGKGEVNVHDAVEPIIDLDTWNRVQEMNAKNHEEFTGRRHPRRQTSDFLLSGMVRCDLCGRLMKGRTHQKKTGDKEYRWRAYYCVNRTEYFEACAARAVPAVRLEERVLDRLHKILTAPELLEQVRLALADEARTDDEIDRAQIEQMRRDLDTLDKAIENLLRAVESGAWETDDEIRSLRQRVGMRETERRELRLALAQAEAQKPAEPTVVPETLDGEELWAAIQAAKAADFRNLQLLMRAMIEEIRVRRGDDKALSGEIRLQAVPGIGRVPLTLAL